MLTIRHQQWAAFEAAVNQSFVNEMVGHVRQFFADQCNSMDADEVRRVCEEGLARAATYGIVSQRDVCKFVNLMFTFGRNFDADPSWPWASQILTDGTVSGPSLRINRLYLEALKYACDGRGLEPNEHA